MPGISVGRDRRSWLCMWLALGELSSWAGDLWWCIECMWGAHMSCRDVVHNSCDSAKRLVCWPGASKLHVIAVLSPVAGLGHLL